jgi:hypothetical protein
MFISIILCQSLHYGILTVWFYHYKPDSLLLFQFVIAVAGIAASGTMIFSLNNFLRFGFSATITLPLLIYMAIHMSFTHAILSIIIITFLAYLYITTTKIRLDYYSSIVNELKLNEKNILLENKIKEIKTLNGLLPICSSCKKIRDDKGYWNQLETYLSKHSDITFSHSLCKDCIDKLYGSDLNKK